MQPTTTEQQMANPFAQEETQPILAASVPKPARPRAEYGCVGPLKLASIPIARPWGGDALCRRFGKRQPAGGFPLGETWEASDVAGAVSCVGDGPLAGMPVSALLDAPLPLLIKLIDAREWLSVQLHPDEIGARALTARRHNGTQVRPKNEAWHVLWAEPGAEIIYGLRDGVTTADLLDGCARGEVDGLLRRVQVHVGDTIYVPAGIVHAIGPGIVLYEVQQPSNDTLRLYDWGRRGLDGNPRALHLDEAGTLLREPDGPDPRLETQLTHGPNPRMNLLKTPYFRLDLFLADRGELVIQEKKFVTFITFTAGGGWIVSDAGQLEVTAGDTVLVPPGVDYCLLPGERGMRVLRAVPGPRQRRSR